MLIQNINNDHVINLIMAGNYMRDIIMCASPFLNLLSKPISRIKLLRFLTPSSQTNFTH